MTAPFYMKTGDTAPSLILKLTNPDGSDPNLLGATGVFTMAGPTGALIVNRRPVTLDNTAKTATHLWQSTDTTTPGICMAEVEITFPDASKMTYPNDGNLAIMVVADLA